MSANRPPRGFTLVEMLVVLGIIAVLVALLMPAVMSAVNNARRAAVGAEIVALDKAVEQYKQKKGDYPPNFRDYQAFIRHVRQVYPKIDSTHLNTFIGEVWTGCDLTNPPVAGTVPNIDEGESLVFWLYLVDNDPRYPFKAVAGTPTTAVTTTLAEVLTTATSAEKLYPFKEDRLVTEDSTGADRFPSYRALYSKDSCYIYIDHRSYATFTNQNYVAFAENQANYTRPYWSDYQPNNTSAATYLGQWKPMQPTGFQIICAGQDGEFGGDPTTFGLKMFKGGGNTSGPPPAPGYVDGDRDNMTNFSEGRRLEDHIP